jgi:hypothetical protein
MTPLDFETCRESESESWSRSDPTVALIEPTDNDNEWFVMLPDSEAVHRVELWIRNGAYQGECRSLHESETVQCPARKYADPSTPCAHLATLRKALVCNDDAVDGSTIKVQSTDDRQHDNDIETVAQRHRQTI